MRDAGADVNRKQPAIESKRAIEFGKTGIGFALEPATPKFSGLIFHKLPQSILPATEIIGNVAATTGHGLTPPHN
jgi:hypothetical protein